MSTVNETERKYEGRPGHALPGLAGPLAQREREGANGRQAQVPAGSAGAVVLDYLRQQAARLQALDPLVRADEPDSVHQMRVTARRLRSTLQSFGQVIPRSQTSEVIAGHPPPALTGAGANWR